MDNQFLWADADGFLGSVVIQQEDLAGLTLRTQANWDDEETEDEDWEEQEDEGDELWDDEDDLEDEDEDWEDEDDEDDEDWEA